MRFENIKEIKNKEIKNKRLRFENIRGAYIHAQQHEGVVTAGEEFQWVDRRSTRKFY